MPRQSEAKKDVIHCEKPWGAVNKLRSADIRMGEPGPQGSLSQEYILQKERTQGTETSKYLQERKSTETPKVVASEIGPADGFVVKNQNNLERLTREGDSPVQVEKQQILEQGGAREILSENGETTLQG